MDAGGGSETPGRAELLIAQGPARDLAAYQEALARRGIAARIVAPPGRSPNS